MFEWTQAMYRLMNSFNVKLNTYVLNGIVQGCGHCEWEDCECEAMKFAGQSLSKVYRAKGWKLSDHR